MSSDDGHDAGRYAPNAAAIEEVAPEAIAFANGSSDYGGGISGNRALVHGDSKADSSNGGSKDDDGRTRQSIPSTSIRERQDSEDTDYGQLKGSVGYETRDDEDSPEEDDDGEDDEEDEEEEDDEPRLKYARLTPNMASVYRNGDATSAFLVAGDKMIVGTHNGNIHVFQLPMFKSLRVYHAHSASVTAISISPFPPPLPAVKEDRLSKTATEYLSSPSRPASRQSNASNVTSPRKGREPATVPNTPSNNIYIATASTDGNVCVQSLVDVKDVQLRSFGRPVQAVALSPEYRQDRTYLSGGLAGHLVLTVCGQPGRSTSATIGTAAATASSWLGSMGLGSNTGKDTILHTGEGTINNIKWSLSGKYVVWLNEHGIKIMRTKLQLDSAETESAWKRIGHIDRPKSEEWDMMASMWKGRAEWIDEQSVELDNDSENAEEYRSSPALEKLHDLQSKSSKAVERLLVGWGSTIWIIHVHPGVPETSGNSSDARSPDRAEIVKINGPQFKRKLITSRLRMDCIISGISLYSQTLLVVLAYCLPDENSEEPVPSRGHKLRPSTASSSSEPSGGIPRRQNNQPPELRLIDLTSQSEVDKDGLSVSRFERLSAADYHLGVLPARSAAAAVLSSKGALDALAELGADMWNAAINPKALFNSGASIHSKNSTDIGQGSLAASTTSTLRLPSVPQPSVHPSLAKDGIKIFVHSPYDCILATRRDLSDHLFWLLEHQDFRSAWELIDEHPDIVTTTDVLPEIANQPAEQTRDDQFEEPVTSAVVSPAEREKRRIGELWIKQMVESGNWARAGQVAGKVLRTSDRWEEWVWTFAGADKFDEIANYIPTELLHPPLRQTIYEVVLGHYLKTDKPRFRELLERWPTDLFDANTLITALENQLSYRDVREDSIDNGEKGRDWHIVVESLAKMHETVGRYREALKLHIRLQDADSAFRLIREHHLAEAVADDIPSFIALRVPVNESNKMTQPELEMATSEAINVLVDEAQHGLVLPETVITQLQKRELNLYTYFYLRGLWNGDGIKEHQGASHDRLIVESKSQLDAFGDLAVQLFSVFDRPLLMEFLKSSTSYSFEKAAAECERFNYIDELVYIYSKTGQMKRALYLIIDRLGDVSRAIAFAKDQDDPDLWEDLVAYSMNKPRFIRGLLEEVGTAINPISLVRRIPEGLEIEGLRDGLQHIMKEYEIQYSICFGVAKVLRNEVSAAQTALRNGQRRGIKFEIVAQSAAQAENGTNPVSKSNTLGVDATQQSSGKPVPSEMLSISQEWTPGHCARCLKLFTEFETDTLVGFSCGHVFHLPHLVSSENDQGIPWLGGGSEANSGRNAIGPKVTHARLLRDKIARACPVCKASASPK